MRGWGRPHLFARGVDFYNELMANWKRSLIMLRIDPGQCGLCVHFGEAHSQEPKLVQIRRTHEAEETFVEECDHPKHAALRLKVTPTSGCDGFELSPEVAAAA